MARRKKESNRVDELLEDYRTPEEILGESGLIKQLSKRLIERALVGELSHHLKTETETEPEQAEATVAKSNRRNGSSSKTIQSERGEMELTIPRDRNGSFEPVLVPKHQRRLAGLALFNDSSQMERAEDKAQLG